MKYEGKVRKKIISLLTLALTISLAGCGKAEGTGETTGTGESGEAVMQNASTLDVFGEDGEEDSPGALGTEGEMTEDGSGEEEQSGMEAEDGEDSDTSEAAEGDLEFQGEKEPGKIPPAQVKERPEGWTMELASEDWGLSFGESGTAPVGNASADDLKWYDAWYVGDDSEKVLYLTFDCGYENGNTEPILDALKKHNVSVTFFVVGHFLETAPDMVRRMVEDGHTVGNHTWHHPDMSAISDMESFQKEMDDVAERFTEITGTELSPFYRPPQGKCNVKNLEMAQELGYYTIFWSLAHVDWITDDQPGHEESIEKLTKRVHPGAIVLLHNTSQTNGEILDGLLTKWEEMGYSFRTLGELVSR